MIKNDNKSISSVYDKTTVIGRIYKGIVKLYESWRKLIANGIPPLTLQKCKGVDLVDYKIYGESVQEKKNLIPFPYVSASGAKSGITYTINADGSIILNGIATTTHSFYLTSTNSLLLKPGKYAVSGSPEGSSNDGYYMVWQNKVFIYNTPQTVTLTKEEGVNIYIAVKEGTVCDNVVFKPQIELNEYTEWESPVISPDNPIEIESMGDKSKNLANLSKTIKSSSTTHVTFDYDNLTGTLELTSKPNTYDYALISAKDLGLEIGKTYNYGGDIIVTGKKTTNSTQVVLKLGVSANSGVATFNEDGTAHLSGKFTYEGQSMANLRLFFNYGSPEPAKVTYKNLYVSETLTEHTSAGYKIPVKVRGINVCNKDNAEIGGITGGAGTNYDNTKQIRTGYDKVKPLTEYYFDIDSALMSSITIFCYNENKEFLTFMGVNTNMGGNFTTKENTAYIRIRINNPSGLDYTEEEFNTVKNKLFICKASEKGEYQPYINQVTNIYLNEPLRKIGDYSDYIDFENQKVIRKIKELVFDGTNKGIDNISQSSGLYYGVVNTDDNQSIGETKHTLIQSNNFKTSYGVSLGATYLANAIRLVMVNTDQTLNTKDLWNEWLKSKYENGEPVVSHYVLLNPDDTETVNLPNIPTNKGTNIIEVDTSISPSNIEVQYYGKGV